MTLHAPKAKITSTRALCLATLCLVATPAAAQSGGADIFTLGPSRDAPAPSGAPTEPAPPAPASATLLEPSAPAEPPRAGARWAVGAGLSGSVYSIHYRADGSTAPAQNGNRGRGYLAPLVYLSPVIDDDAPRSLQPFLQRTSTISAGISGGGA